MIQKEKGKSLPILIGVSFVFFLTVLLFFHPKVFEKGQIFIENRTYDLLLRHSYRPVSKDLPIAIVDIDDHSLLVEGRWPWPRNQIAALIGKLYERGASVVALNITFPQPELNIADAVFHDLQKNPETDGDWQQVRELFNDDKTLAKALSRGPSVLSFVIKSGGNSIGTLPSPLLELTPEQVARLAIPHFDRYISNIDLLEKGAKSGGFSNAVPDRDGINRFSPMLYSQGNQVYPSIGLEAARIFLHIQKPQLLIAEYGDTPVLEGILFDKQKIPTDPYGKLLIPFRGPSHSIPYISATDILHDTAPKDALQNKLVFVGSSATAVGEVVASSMSPAFLGVEIHADIASGIIENYLPYRPTWGKGVTTFFVFFVGMLAACVFPLLGPIGLTLLASGLFFSLVKFNQWMWMKEGLVLSFSLPLATIMILYLMNLIWGYLTKSRKRLEVTSTFGQYIPPERIRLIVEKGAGLGLEGETKELSVLFTDIRGFTTLSEGLNAQDLKDLLNRYLTMMTQTIFQHKGTVDKYVGDMIVAFWGAPLDDPEHAFNAVSTGLDMQKNLDSFNVELRKEGKTEIRVGVGINSGLMNVGDMGSQFRHSYTVIGEPVHLASRFETICRYYDVRILVGEDTYQRVKEKFAFRKIDQIQAKGTAKSFAIYEPLCLKEQCTPEKVALMDLHQEAMEAYFKQDWEKAQTAFLKLQATDPTSQTLYQIYLTRIASLRITPPSADWTGVYVLEPY